jgi:hypothetical protein
MNVIWKKSSLKLQLIFLDFHLVNLTFFVCNDISLFPVSSQHLTLLLFIFIKQSPSSMLQIIFKIPLIIRSILVNVLPFPLFSVLFKLPDIRHLSSCVRVWSGRPFPKSLFKVLGKFAIVLSATHPLEHSFSMEHLIEVLSFIFVTVFKKFMSILLVSIGKSPIKKVWKCSFFVWPLALIISVFVI